MYSKTKKLCGIPQKLLLYVCCLPLQINYTKQYTLRSSDKHLKQQCCLYVIIQITLPHQVHVIIIIIGDGGFAIVIQFCVKTSEHLLPLQRKQGIKRHSNCFLFVYCTENGTLNALHYGIQNCTSIFQQCYVIILPLLSLQYLVYTLCTDILLHFTKCRMQWNGLTFILHGMMKQ